MSKDQWIAETERIVDRYDSGDLTFGQAMDELIEIGVTAKNAFDLIAGEEDPTA